jgi:ribose transport system substrate-binding protein
MTVGTRLALKRTGINPATIPITGIDYISEMRDAVLAGEQVASFTYPSFGIKGAEYALCLLSAETVPKEVILDSVMVTREYAESVELLFL